MSNPVSDPIPLQKPIVRGDGKIQAVTIRKPSSGELRGLKLENLLTSDVSSLLTLIPRISDPALLPNEADDLDPADLAEIGGAIVGFFLTPAQKAHMERLTGQAPRT